MKTLKFQFVLSSAQTRTFRRSLSLAAGAAAVMAALTGCGGSGAGGPFVWPTLFLAQFQFSKVSSFSGSDGTGLTSSSTSGLPYSVAVDKNGRIYASLIDTHQIVAMDDINGTNKVWFGAQGSGSGQFDTPGGVAVDGQSRIYVGDSANVRLVRMDDMTGAGWTTFDLSPYFTSTNRTYQVAVDKQGRIYVLSRGDRMLLRIDSMAGENPVTYGTSGGGVGQFELPSDVFVDGSNRIYVADTGNDRVARIDSMTGGNWTTFGTTGAGVGQYTNPAGVCTDSRGHIYVRDNGNYRVARMDDMAGTGWTTIGDDNSGHVANSGDMALK